ncbi:MAG TPA: hypothetical protein VES88_08365 [Gemmatimonadaceae bacterium]|nr:hypothetical protein [Gemmatimonadaceae bacterium]
MKVAILADDRPSYVRPLAEGLFRMLEACGAEPVMHYDGLAHLGLRRSVDPTSLRSIAGSTLRLIPSRRAFDEFVERVGDADLIVVVLHVPASFAKGVFPNIETLRERLPNVPVVNYDMVFLPTLNSWARFLLRGEKTAIRGGADRIFDRGSYGLERYDWYLMGSVERELRLPPGPLPYSLIGLDLDDGSLYPDQGGEFSVLVDFIRHGEQNLAYRKVQLDALRLAGVDYVVLEGRYSMKEIREVYRRSSMYFLAFCESFGLPVCELQACGCRIYMPDTYWASSHWISESVYGPRKPEYSSNFVVYENDPELLAERIREEARTFDPARVRATFERVQPQLLHGDRAALSEFLERAEDGTIHSRLHKSHVGVGG